MTGVSVSPASDHGEAVAVAVAATAWLATAVAPVALRPAAVGGTGLALATTGLAVALGRSTAARLLGIVGLVAGVALVGGHRGAAAEAAWQPLPIGPLSATAVLVDDPRPAGVAGWRAEVRLAAGERVEVTAYGRPGVELARLGVGDRAELSGRLLPLGERPWLRVRHVVARASLSSVTPIGGPDPPRRAVEWVRDRIAAGGDGLDHDARALHLGLVLGDDRFQTPGQVLRFRLTGLSHLLAVSGQNVAFVLAVLAPVLRRLGQRSRLGVVGTALVVFALITRLEPSVLRAVVTAGLSTWAATTGRSRPGLGLLAVAVVVLLGADPFLVDAVGFQLSVAASAGILLLGPPLANRLPGPDWFSQPLAVGLGAQIGVAPLLGHHFGPVSLVSIPANLVAGWAAAATMVWGLTIGPVLPLLPGPLASVARLPVRCSLWWLETVATFGARAPAPRPSLVVLVGLAVTGLLVRPLHLRWPRRLVAAVAVAVVWASVPSAPDHPGSCGPGLHWYPADAADGRPSGRSVLVVDGEAGLRGVEACRRAGVRRVDVVVAAGADRATGAIVAALGEVMAIDHLLAPPHHAVVGARRVLEPVRIPTGAGPIIVAPDAAGRRLSIARDPPTRPAGVRGG